MKAKRGDQYGDIAVDRGTSHRVSVPPPVIPVFFKGANLPAAEVALVAVDGGGQGPGDLEVSFTHLQDAFEKPADGPRDPRFWKGTAVVRNMPSGGEFQRTVLLQLGTVTDMTAYTLKNSRAGTLSWELAPPPRELRLGPSRKVTVAVKVGERPLRGFQLVQSTLQDPESKLSLGLESIELEPADGSLPANTTTPVTITIKEGFKSPGAFDGNLTFGIEEDSNLKNVELLVYSRRNVRPGVGLIFVGLALSWITGVWLARRADRASALRALAIVRRKIPAFRKVIDTIQGRRHPLKEIDDRASRLSTNLDPETPEIKALLPPPVWAPRATPWDRAPFESHVQDQTKLATVLAEIIDGLELVLEGWERWGPRKRETALDALNRILAPQEVPELADVRAEVEKVIEELHRPPERGGIVPQAAVAAFAARPRKCLSLRQLEVQLATIGFARWGLWAVLTLVIGYVVLIMTDLGFGSPADLVQCFFWGLGVQAASEGLDQLTRESSGTVLGLEVPD